MWWSVPGRHEERLRARVGDFNSQTFKVIRTKISTKLKVNITTNINTNTTTIPTIALTVFANYIITWERFVEICRVKNACVGEGGERERALDDVFGI